ncbi:Peroxisome biosynthesis protein PAS1 [Candida viswanathii]|uniref:Peroxisomal ATPase PEX1 n=1 Tax=Candida viswanathii TaxID=5486 RepID=A0A367YHZ3_9ASCO|nr:Peroxisome biosynthesis protein PAS1 [Candida viswanathii]
MDNHKATITYKTLKSNLVNLPSHLTNLLFTANIKVQDVIVEIVTDTPTSKSKPKHYAGWSGMSSSGSITSLEIDPIFAQSLNLTENMKIVINLKLGNYESSNINLEPLTSSDWELVELHAQLIEDKLLSQTRCVALNQVLVVYPNSSTYAKLLVTDLGKEGVLYAKISPYCEIAIAPKVRKKEEEKSSTTAKSVGSSKSTKRATAEDYSDLPLVLKRGISLPHGLYDVKEDKGYVVYVDVDELTPRFGDYVAVSVIPGPNDKTAKSVDEENKDLKENKRIVAKVNIGISRDLSVSLNIENQIGNMISLKPAVRNLPKRPTTFTIHPYIIHTKKKEVTINKKDNKVLQQLTEKLYPEIASLPVTNFTKIPIIPSLLPYGGLLRFRKNDDYNAWIKPYNLDSKKPIKLELGDELLRPQSFIEQPATDDSDLEAIGLDATVEDIVDSFATSQNTGTLIHGNSGSGKTLLLKLAAAKLNSEHGFYTKYISCESIMNENFQNLSKNHLFKYIQQCAWNKPSLLILDNIDKIMNIEMENMDATKSNQVTEFFISTLAKIHNQTNSNLSILISATSKESINKLLLGSHLIENFVHLNAPDKALRFDILEQYLTKKLELKVKVDLMDLVSETEGYLPNDLKILSDRIYHEVLFSDSEENTVKAEHIEKALTGYTPSNLRGVKLQKSSINWTDIGGLKEAKNVLLETLEWPTKYAPIFANCPLRLRSGILLYGYPGCGKTLLASAISGQCGLNFISIKGPEILNKYIGASEQSVRELFERAQAAKPCILFFDEFDSIAPKRGHDSTGVTDRVVNQMLTQMDGAEGLDGVYVLAATSRPDLIDSALLRPGRLDKSVICDMPNYEDRLDILKSITTKMELADDVNLEEIAEKSQGFSGADIQGLVSNTFLKGVHVTLEELSKKEQEEESSTQSDPTNIEFFKVGNTGKKMKSNERVKLLHQIQQFINADDNNASSKKSQDLMGKSKVLITHDNFVQSLKETKPSISHSEKIKLSKIYKQFVNDRDGNMPDGTASNEIGGRTTLM